MTKMDLQSRACLVYVAHREPRPSKRHRAACPPRSRRDKGASDRTVNAVVRLVPEDYLKPLAKHAQRVRRVVEHYSAPWAAAGVRILPYARGEAGGGGTGRCRRRMGGPRLTASSASMRRSAPRPSHG
jgi:hypothetical protein